MHSWFHSTLFHGAPFGRLLFTPREKRSVNKAHKDEYLLTPPSHMTQHIAAQHNIVLAAVVRVSYSMYILLACLQ